MIITWGQGSLLSQIFFLNFSSEIILALMGHARPYLTRKDHWLEMTNEFLIRLVLISLLVCQTDFVQDVKAKSDMGYAFIALIVFVVTLNFSLVTIENTRLLCQKIKIRYLKREQANKLRKANQQIAS